MKRIISALLCAVLLAGLSACKKDNTVSEQTQSEVQTTENIGVQDGELDLEKITEEDTSVAAESDYNVPAYKKPAFDYIKAIENRDYDAYIKVKFTNKLKKKCIEEKFGGNQEAFDEYYQKSFENKLEDYTSLYGEDFRIQVMASDDYRGEDPYNLEVYGKKLSEKYGCTVELSDFYTCLMDIYFEAGEESESADYIVRTGKIDGEWKILYFYEDL